MKVNSWPLRYPVGIYSSRVVGIEMTIVCKSNRNTNIILCGYLFNRFGTSGLDDIYVQYVNIGLWVMTDP